MEQPVNKNDAPQSAPAPATKEEGKKSWAQLMDEEDKKKSAEVEQGLSKLNVQTPEKNEDCK
jgi:hypothetical protein